MKITNTTRQFSNETFRLELKAELTIGLEEIQDSMVMLSADEYALILGKELLKQLNEGFPIFKKSLSS